MMEWFHAHHFPIGCAIYGFFLVMALVFGRIVGRLTRAVAWWLAASILTVGGMTWGAPAPAFVIVSEEIHGTLTFAVLMFVLVMTPAAVVLDRRHG